MVSYLSPLTDPDIVESNDIVKKPRKARRPRWVPDDPHMETHRHHFWRCSSFLVEHVEAIFDELKVVISCR